MEINQVLLGVQTMFGDSDVVQTHLLLWGFFTGLLSIILLIVTLNMQRSSLANQIKVNDLQNKIILRDIKPLINLIVQKEVTTTSLFGYSLELEIFKNQAIIHSFDFISKTSLIKSKGNLFDQFGIPLNQGKKDLLTFVTEDPNKTLLSRVILNNELKFDDFNFEIIYGDIYSIAKYKEIYRLERLFGDKPTFEIISHETIY